MSADFEPLKASVESYPAILHPIIPPHTPTSINLPPQSRLAFAVPSHLFQATAISSQTPSPLGEAVLPARSLVSPAPLSSQHARSPSTFSYRPPSATEGKVAQNGGGSLLRS